MYASHSPSGLTAAARPCGTETRSGSPPSAATVNSSAMRGFDANAFVANSSRPSGVQSASASPAGWCVTRVGTPPVTGTTYRSRFPS